MNIILLLNLAFSSDFVGHIEVQISCKELKPYIKSLKVLEYICHLKLLSSCLWLLISTQVLFFKFPSLFLIPGLLLLLFPTWWLSFSWPHKLFRASCSSWGQLWPRDNNAKGASRIAAKHQSLQMLPRTVGFTPHEDELPRHSELTMDQDCQTFSIDWCLQEWEGKQN